MDPLFTTFGTGRHGSLPQILSPGKHKLALSLVSADIDAVDWLSEVGMSQYLEVFLANFTTAGSRVLSRHRLSLVRLEHMPKMGITQFPHQKILLEHIRHTLKFEFNSPVRRREVEARMSVAEGGEGSGTGGALSKFRAGKLQEIPERNLAGANNKKMADHHKQAAPTRRRSFDKNVWQSIHTLRTGDATSLAAVEQLREGNYQLAEKIEGKAQEKRRRRRSYGEDDKPGAGGAKEYGNRVQLYDIMQRELHELQIKHLEKLKKIVKCERANIFFINEKTKELFLASDSGVWFRMMQGNGLAGYCADHGMVLNVPNVQADARFNLNLDLKTGWKTKNAMLCPLRGNRGGGVVIGVVQCSNKVLDFDAEDEEHLQVCCRYALGGGEGYSFLFYL